MNEFQTPPPDRLKEALARLALLCLVLIGLSYAFRPQISNLFGRLQEATKSAVSPTSSPKTSAFDSLPALTDDPVFLDMLRASLSVSTYTNHDENNGITYDRRVDVTTPGNGIVYTAETIDGKLYYESISSLQTEYTKHISENTWAQTRKNWVDIESWPARELDAKHSIFGQVLMGNPGVESRAKIISYIQKNELYRQGAPRSEEVIDGLPVYVYNVKIKTDPIVKLNQYAANVYGVAAPKWEYIWANSNERKYYVRRDPPRYLVRVTEMHGRWHSFEQAQTNHSTRILTYSNINEPVSVPRSPGDL